MNKREYDNLTDDQRALILAQIDDTARVKSSDKFASLPYWLQHTIAHYVKGKE